MSKRRELREYKVVLFNAAEDRNQTFAVYATTAGQASKLAKSRKSEWVSDPRSWKVLSVRRNPGFKSAVKKAGKQTAAAAERFAAFLATKGKKLAKNPSRKVLGAGSGTKVKKPMSAAAKRAFVERMAAARKGSTRKNAGPNSFRKTKKELRKGGVGIKSSKRRKHSIKGASGWAEKHLAAEFRKKRRNGETEAADRYKFFHGKEPDEVITVTERVHEHAVLSGIGKLRSITLKAINGGLVELKGFGAALLAQDEKGTQLYIKGGDQSVNLREFGISNPHELEVLGDVTQVVYGTEKTHLRPEDGGKADYHHEFGKNRSRLPELIYDVRNKTLAFAGGGYDLPEVGIRG